MGLPKSIANIFAARNIITAKDVLSSTEFELMELLDVGVAEVLSAVAHISEIVSPPYQTALSLMDQRVRNEYLAGHLPTCLKGLDEALCGGIPSGVLAEFLDLQQIKVSLLQHQVKLLVIDSMAALVTGLLAEFSRIPVVVTNQVRSQSRDETSQYSFQVQNRSEFGGESIKFDSHLVAALGIHWAHAVTIRLVLEAKSVYQTLKKGQ